MTDALCAAVILAMLCVSMLADAALRVTRCDGSCVLCARAALRMRPGWMRVRR